MIIRYSSIIGAFSKIFTLVSYLLLSAFAFTQNLVLNPSFEKYSQCPYGEGQLGFAEKCSSPPSNSGRYLHSCATNPIFSVPASFSPLNPAISYDYQQPHSGEAYVACYMINGYGQSYREYVQMELFSPLINLKYYNVEFWTVKGNTFRGGNYAVNNIGLTFNSSFIDTTAEQAGPSVSLFDENVDIIKFSNPIIADTLDWVKVSGIYQATGSENYLVIGNFKIDIETDTIVMLHPDGWFYPGAIYFFDDVSVTEITEPFWQYHDTTVYYGDSVLIGPALTGLDIDWFTANMEFIENAPGIFVTPPTSRDYIAKETFNGVETTHVVHVTVIGSAGVGEEKMQVFNLFPNPSTGNFSISGIETNEKLKLEVRDVQGKLVFETDNLSKETNSFELEVENGVYFVTVEGGLKNRKMVEKIVLMR